MAEPWSKFRNLCQYYADCVKYSEHGQEYLFPNQLGKTFMMPRLPVDWHLKSEEFVVETSREDAYVRSCLMQASDEDELFIGYPLNSFVSPDGFDCLCPVLMFPVAISVRRPGYVTGMRMTIDRQGISINQDWVDYHVPRSEQRAFRRACERTADEAGCVDVEMVLNYLSAHFKAVELDPNRMQFSIRNSQSKQGLLNTAVLFEGTKTKYTKNLIAELHRISREPDAVLDKTALAHVFREPRLPHEPHSAKRIPVSFTQRQLNAGQFAAVEESLNSPVVKVMGPPGTGKSFMSVNLIANEVLAGGRVIFTSKNHKAVHAIFDKAPDAVENGDLPLVSFCTTPDNPENADWRKSQKDVDCRLARLEAIRRADLDGLDAKEIGSLDRAATEELDVWLSTYRDAESHIERYQRQRDLISRYERLLGKLETALGNVPCLRRDSDETVRLLEACERLLASSWRPTFAQRIVMCLGALAGRRKSELDVLGQLADIAPRVSGAIVSRETATKEVRRLLKLLKCRRLVKEWERAEYDVLKAERSAANFDELKSTVGRALDGARRVVQRAYVESLLARTKGLENADSLVAFCRDAADEALKRPALPFLTAVGDGSKYDAACAWFRRYLDVFPAWASTMLSLRRAAPCLPGVFTLAVIDEASQCEIPPMIPVLFRAQRVAVVGDPNQFPPVITLKESRDAAFRRRYGISGSEFDKFAFRSCNVFSVIPGEPHLLNEHFRCADGIAEYFNEEFYDNELSLCCETGRHGESAVGASKPGMMWVDAPGGDAAEIDATLEYLRGLKRNGFKGTIGIISPLRDLANRLKTRVAEDSASVPPQLDIQSQISTANGFQGGECDVVLFLLGLNADRTRGQDWYITAPENKYIYNVSVSRAKQLFVAVGDRKRVSACGLSYIQKLVPEARPPRSVKVGPGEERLRVALERAGIKTVPQFPVLNRFLDLAIPEKKIDIEVDGQAWHLDCRGCRKADDIHRDIQLEAAGWKVVRFWHHDVVSNVTDCVNKVAKTVES